MEFKAQLFITKTSIIVVDYIKSTVVQKTNQILEKWLDFDISSKKDIDELISTVYLVYPEPTNLYLGDLSALSLNAQQACLKLIEEPPHNLKIYLSSENINQVLDTIVSRCQVTMLLDSQIVKFLNPVLLDACLTKLPPASQTTKLILNNDFTIDFLGDLSKIERNELKFYLWQISFNLEAIYKNNQDSTLGLYLDNVISCMSNLDSNLQKKIALIPLLD